MKIVLKDADFSQSGILAPHTVVLNSSKMLSEFNGSLFNNSDSSRGADISNIPIANNKLNNGTTIATLIWVCFYASDGTYLGCIGDGSNGYIVIAGNTSIRLDQASHYMKPVDATHVTEMTAQEVETLKANAAYFRVAAKNNWGSLSALSLSLDIIS